MARKGFGNPHPKSGVSFRSVAGRVLHYEVLTVRNEDRDSDILARILILHEHVAPRVQNPALDEFLGTDPGDPARDDILELA